MKHILVTTDLSEEARRAFVPIRQLASDLGAKVTLLHIVESLTKVASGGMFATPITTIDVDEQKTMALSRLEEEKTAFGSEVEVSTAVTASATVGTSICDFADKNGVDMIAISTHGYSGLKRMIMGSVAEDVIRHSKVPVLSYPPPA